MATLIGLFTLGRDAELRTTQGGDEVAGLALAYNYGRKENGKQPTQWIDAALWGERAGKLEQWLVKGAQFLMHVEDIHVETYDKRDGGQGVKLVGRVAHIEFTRGGVPEGDQQRAPATAPAPRQQQRQAPAPRPAPAPRAASGFDDMDDDIPFRDPLSYRGAHLVL